MLEFQKQDNVPANLPISRKLYLKIDALIKTAPACKCGVGSIIKELESIVYGHIPLDKDLETLINKCETIKELKDKWEPILYNKILKEVGI